MHLFHYVNHCAVPIQSTAYGNTDKYVRYNYIGKKNNNYVYIYILILHSLQFLVPQLAYHC